MDFPPPPERPIELQSGLPHWENDLLQFPRLLSEIIATQDNLDFNVLAESMDLSFEEVTQLFDRAQNRWEYLQPLATMPVPQEGTASMSEQNNDQNLQAEIERERHLTQLLGVSLRGVLPYAEAHLDTLTGDTMINREPDIKREIKSCSVYVQRAQQALQHLNDSEHSILNVQDDAFDDEFKIVFEDDE